MPRRTNCSRKNCRLRTLVAAVLAALAFATLAGLDLDAHAQRGSKNANTAQQKKPASTKRVFIGAGSSTSGGARQTIKSDNPLNDYSAYRSGDRFNVVIPNADANAIAKGGAGRGYSDMQVQQRGNDVVLTYKLQPGAKPRVEQKFNRLDVVFETPEGAAAAKPAQAQPNTATGNTPATSAQQQPNATRNPQTAPPSSTTNAAPNRTQTAAAPSTNTSQHAAQQQQQTAPAPNASELQTASPTNAATTTTAPPATGEAAQNAPAATPAELELAQARQPETSAPATRANAPATTAPTLGATLLRNWPLALTVALLLVGLGLFFAARRTSAATRTPPPVEEARPAVIEKTEPAAIEEAKHAVTAEATPTLKEVAPVEEVTPVEEATPAVGQMPMPVVFVDAHGDAKEAVKPQRAKERGRKGKNRKAGKGKNKTEAPAVAAKQETPAPVAEDATTATPLVETPGVAPLVAASALAGATAATEERVDEETQAAPLTEEAAPAAAEETPVAVEAPTEETVVTEAPVEETAAEEAAVAEAVEETVVAETPFEETVVESAAGEETAGQIAAVEETVVEEVAEETRVEEAPVEETVVESAAVEDALVDEVAADETVVEEAAGVEPSTVEPSWVVSSLVESSSVEPSPVESSVVEAPPVEEDAEDVDEVAALSSGEVVKTIEAVPVVSADSESVQAEVRRLLDGERYDRGVLKSADMMARQIVAAELLSALSGRNPERRWRARTAFIEHGFFNESAHDLHYAEAPAERAAAARALALAGDRAATSHLVAALEDKSIDVRRAAVEALADLRDPAAVGPLEEVRERQKQHREKLPRRLLQHAIETCREGSAVAPAVVAPAAETAAVETDAEVTGASEETVEESAAAPVEEVAAEPVASPKDEPAVAEESEPVIEDAAAWFSIVSAGEPPVVEETRVEGTSDAATEEAAVAEAEGETPVGETQVVGAEEEATVVEAREDAAVVEAGEETFVEKSFAPVVADEVEDAAPALVEETLAIEPAAASPSAEAVEAETAAPSESEPAVAVEPKEVEPVIEDAAAWFALVSSGEAAAVEETPADEARAVESSFEETAIEAAKVEETPAAVWSFGDVSPEETVVEEARSGEIEPLASEPPAWFTESEAATLEGFDMPAEVGAKAVEPAAAPSDSALGAAAEDWIELDVEETSFAPAAPVQDAPRYDPAPTEIEARGAKLPPSRFARESAAPPRASAEEKGVELFDELSTVPKAIQHRIASADTSDRASALADLSRLDTDEAFHHICAAFDDESREVRNAAARALFDLKPDRADSFTRALREAAPERRRNIGAAINNSGLAADAVGQLTGESREKTYEAFSLLFLMAKAGEVQPLLRAIESHPDSEVRLAVVKLLALSGQKEVLPAFRRLAVRGSLPTEVRSAVMEAIYQISSQDAHSAA